MSAGLIAATIAVFEFPPKCQNNAMITDQDIIDFQTVVQMP